MLNLINLDDFGYDHEFISDDDYNEVSFETVLAIEDEFGMLD